MSTAQIAWDEPSTQSNQPAQASQVKWDDTPKEQPSIASKIWSTINTPLIKGKTLLDIASIGAQKPPDMKPGESTYDYLKRNEQYINPDHPILAAIRAGLSGAAVDTADTISSFTSPASLGLAASGTVAKALPATAKVINAVSALAGAGLGIAGAKQAISAASNSSLDLPTRTQQVLQGAAAASGGAGAGLDLVKGVAARAALLGKTPQEAYKSALKPSTALSQSATNAAIETGLENKIPVSQAGISKISNLIDDLNDSISNQIARDPNRPIDKSAVASRIGDVYAKFSKQVNPTADLNAIEASRDEFMANNPAQIPASDAQAMKQGTYQVLKGKYGEQGSASTEAQKALARGLKEEIATQFPEIDKLNAQESKLYGLQPILERAVQRISNHQLIGIGTPLAASAGEAITGSATAGGVVGILKSVLDNPSVKSRLAIAISKGGKGMVPLASANAMIAAYSAALAQASSDSSNAPRGGQNNQ